MLHTRTFRKSFHDVPRDWFAGNTVATQLVNSINLLFPEGERFFVRSVRRFESEIDDPELRAQMRGFYAQEGQHANAHERYFKAMREQGFDIDALVKLAERLLRPRLLSKEMCLSITVALEHYTAVMAELMYTDPFFARMEEPVRSLLLWHAAEEIEHKSVAFDVLQKIDPSYRLRILGLVYSTVTLSGFWIWGAVTLMRQDKLGWRRIRGEMTELRKQDPIIKRVFLRGIREYLRRDFHPSQNDDAHLAAEWFAAHGMALPEAA